MAQIYCLSCGNPLDARAAFRNRCGRCPNCGSRAAGRDRCPSCGHPEDEAAISRMERELDPRLPLNQKEIWGLDQVWHETQIWRRVSLLKVRPVLRVASVVILLWLLALSDILGVGRQWAGVATGLLSSVRAGLMVRQMRRGRLQWFLRRS